MFEILFALIMAFSTPCASDDGSTDSQFGCYWDASTQGDGRGTSFLVLK